MGSGFDSVISGVGLLAGLGVGVLTGRLIARSVEREYERRRQSVGAVYIGREGAIVGGRFHAWDGLGQSVHEAKLLPGKPATLNITIAATSVSNGTQNTTYHNVYIPVAAGMEAKAAEVFVIGPATSCFKS